MSEEVFKGITDEQEARARYVAGTHFERWTEEHRGGKTVDELVEEKWREWLTGEPYQEPPAPVVEAGPLEPIPTHFTPRRYRGL